MSSDPLSASESEAPTHPRKPQPSHSSPPVECVVPTIESSDPVEDSFAAVPAVNAPAGPLRDVPPDRQGSIGVEPNPTANPGQSGPSSLPDGTTEAARREQDHTHSREAAPEDFAESGAPAEPEELIDEPSHPTGAVAPEAVRITRSGRAGLQVSATHMQPTTQKNGDMERQQHPAARRILSCKGTEARDSPGHTTTVWCPNVAHLAFRDLSTYRHRDERHPRKLATVVTSRRHWHPPWDALVEAEEITESNTPEHEMCAQWWCLAITATATVTM